MWVYNYIVIIILLAETLEKTPALPESVEENWGPEQNRFRRAAGIIDFQSNLDKQVVSCCVYLPVSPF